MVADVDEEGRGVEYRLKHPQKWRRAAAGGADRFLERSPPPG
jgi:hypothetical protein